jgi:hypothetical protein
MAYTFRWYVQGRGPTTAHMFQPGELGQGLRVMTGATAYRATLDYHLLFRKSLKLC